MSAKHIYSTSRISRKQVQSIPRTKKSHKTRAPDQSSKLLTKIRRKKNNHCQHLPTMTQVTMSKSSTKKRKSTLCQIHTKKVSSPKSKMQINDYLSYIDLVLRMISIKPEYISLINTYSLKNVKVLT